MPRNTLMGLDELLLDVPDQIERQYLEEAVKCYHIEAYRAAVILSWIVTARNLEKKLEQLAREDGEARNYWVGIDNKKKNEQSYEEDLVDACRVLGILDDQEAKELKHLKDTRNWCAHPTNYEPTAEKVRHCLRSAVEYALARPIIRGFAYIRSLAEDRILDQFFFPSSNPDEVDGYVREMLDRLRSDLHSRLAERMVHTFQDSNSTATTQENIRLFLSSMVRQSPPGGLSELTQAVEPLLDTDLRTGAVILSSRPESIDHLGILQRDRLKAFVIDEVTAGAIPDPLMLHALEAIVASSSLDEDQIQQMGDSLRMHIYDLYSQLENQDAPFFANILIERLESDFARTYWGERGTDFNRANPAAQFIQRIGLDSFDSQPVESRQRLADAIAVAAAENAYDAIRIFASTTRLSDEWLRLLLDGLAHHLMEHNRFHDLNVLISPLTEWASRGHDLTTAWKDLLQQSCEEYERQSPETDFSLPMISWYPTSPRESVKRLAEMFEQVAHTLRDRGYDDSLVVRFVAYLRAVHPSSFSPEATAEGF